MSDLIILPSETKFEKKIDKKLKRAQSLVGTSDGRAENDYYPTPPEATQALLRVEKFSRKIWEPACGDGSMSIVLENAGYEVMSTDLIDYGYGEAPHDFLTSDRTCENIITNPPFILAEKFVELGLQRTTGKVALLCKLQFLEGAKRKIMFESAPLKTVWVFSKRISMYRNGKKEKYGSSMIAFAWFVFQHGWIEDPIIKWL